MQIVDALTISRSRRDFDSINQASKQRECHFDAIFLLWETRSISIESLDTSSTWKIFCAEPVWSFYLCERCLGVHHPPKSTEFVDSTPIHWTRQVWYSISTNHQLHNQNPGTKKYQKAQWQGFFSPHIPSSTPLQSTSLDCSWLTVCNFHCLT